MSNVDVAEVEAKVRQATQKSDQMVKKLITLRQNKAETQKTIALIEEKLVSILEGDKSVQAYNLKQIEQVNRIKANLEGLKFTVSKIEGEIQSLTKFEKNFKSLTKVGNTVNIDLYDLHRKFDNLERKVKEAKLKSSSIKL